MAPLAELAAAAAGLLLLLTAAVWRLQLRRQSVRQVRQAMLDPDPATRRAAVFVASDRGLGPYVDLLVERSHEESDKTVRHALAEAVTRNQWEPADRGPLVELRLWAQRELEPRPTVSSNGHGQNGHGQNGHGQNGHGQTGADVATKAVRAPAEAPARTEAPAEAPVHIRAPPPPPPTTKQEPLPRPAPTRPSPTVRRPARLRVVVTGAGGPAGVAVIRALAAAGHQVVAGDADGMAAGIRLAKQSGVLPRADDPAFVERLCDLAFETGARALVPTLAEELVVLARARVALEEVGLESWIPEPGAVETCIDKWRFAQALAAAGLPGCATKLGSADGVEGPWIVKPRFGRGSRHVHAVDDADGLAWALSRVPEPIVQTRLSGREFTVDALVDRDGQLAGAVPRWRLETKAGISTKGRTFVDRELTAGVAELLEAVGLVGPANVQGFVDADGRATFVEVNPRFSGGLPLSLAAGADLVGEYLRGVFGETIRPERLAYRSGVTMIRHFEELFE